jgi:large subunit ribosomal protein L9
MKVLLLKDVYKLGHAGDVKKVADGYGRNYLIPRSLAALATKSVLAQSEAVRTAADKQRTTLNAEMSGLAEKINGLTLRFPAKAGDTGKLYGSITTQHLAEAIERAIGEKIDRRNIGHQPLRELGTFKVQVRLTADLLPHVTVLVHREGQAIEAAAAAPAPVSAEPALAAEATAAEETAADAAAAEATAAE